MEPANPSLKERLKKTFIGPPRELDSNIFHKISLIAFFAWIGLGADGLSSSSYGPEEAFRVLQGHPYLGIFVALATAVTVFIIGQSYTQIIELFPSSTGSGGYIVASKFLSPRIGMVSGCALLVDYILTITVSIAACSDAIFSFLPMAWYPFKLEFAVGLLLLLTLLNLRGVKESVLILAPIFIIFVITHAFLISYALYSHWMNPVAFVSSVNVEVSKSVLQLGVLGTIILVLKAFSMGAGTYTGLEAVSNGIPILREPRIKTAKTTMDYMMVSLAITAGGLMLAYIFFNVGPHPGKTFNAVLLESVAGGWGVWGARFIIITLISEAALLFVGAQAGFLDGPRILANMGLDGWMPKRFTLLSDRFVNQNGILIMGVSGLAMMLLAAGSVQFLVVLYSINVFLTFTLSTFGTLVFFWRHRNAKIKNWLKKFLRTLLALSVTTFILISVVILKFEEGGWLTLFVTGICVYLASTIRSHYDRINVLLRRLDDNIMSAFKQGMSIPNDVIKNIEISREIDTRHKTAVVLVKGFNGMGLHMIAHILDRYPEFKNFIFIQIGILDSGNFKGMSEIDHLREHTKGEVEKYVSLMRHHGFFAESAYELGIDVAEVVESKLAPAIRKKYPDAVFFGGKIVLPEPSLLSKILDNYTILSLERRLKDHGIPFVVLPINV
jgi:amino acid transporter